MQQGTSEVSETTPSTSGEPERIIQTLSTMMIQLNALQAQVSPENTDKTWKGLDLPSLRLQLDDLKQMLWLLLHELRAAQDSNGLTNLKGLSLGEALSLLVEEAAEKLGLFSRISITGEAKPLTTLTNHLLYRITQEALYQIQQHLGTHRIRLVLAYGPEEVQLSIEDDGTSRELEDDSQRLDIPPFNNIANNSQILLEDIKHRVEHLGGSVESHSSIETGTRIQARLPYQAQSATPSVPEAVQPAPLPEKTITVLLVESQAMTRAGLHYLLQNYRDIQIIGEAADGLQAVSETLELGPQVVLMDMQLPNSQSIEALRQIKQLNAETRVLLLTTQDREDDLYDTLRAGADGYVLKDIAPDELAESIRTVARGEVLIQPQIAGRLITRFGRQMRGEIAPDTLTTREQEVLNLLARGMRNKEIARALNVSERTVNFHLANIYQKLNVSGRTEALSKALDQGLISARHRPS